MQISKIFQTAKTKQLKLANILLITLAVIFVVIKIGIPACYQGSFVDEYYHILSGVEFFKTGHFAEIYPGEYYQRGAHTSFLAGIFTTLFGKTIFVAKLLPALLGIINFFLLYKISKYFFNNKFYTLIVLAIFTASPWFIFNHFYIRTYVLYEFFMLFLTLLFLLIVKNIKNAKKLLAYFSLLISSLLIIFLFSNDSSMYPVLLYALFLISYLYFFQLQNITNQKPFLQKITRNQKIKAFIFLTAISFSFLFINPVPKITKLFFGSITYSASPELGYANLFFHLNLPFTVLFLSSIGLIFLKKASPSIKTIILGSFLLFLLHCLSSRQMQITRGIIYFLPLFYLTAVFSFYQFSIIFKNKLFISLVLIFFAVSIWQNYPKNFLSQGPYLPAEVDYLDYKKAYRYLSQKPAEEIIIIDSSPHTSQFYTSKKVSVLITEKEKLLDKKTRIYSKKNKKENYFFPYGEIPLIESFEENKEKIKDKYILIRKPIAKAYLNKKTLQKITQNREKVEFANIDIYKPEKQ